MSQINPSIKLAGKHVQLRPINIGDEEGLNDAAADGELYNLWYTQVPSPKMTRRYIEQALNQQQKGQSMAFTVIDKNSGNILGSTRFCNIDINNKRLEIGYTWYRQSVQRSAVNTETKLLMLSYAFETFEAIAVEFRTHWINFASRNAILRLGAKQDGVLRNHRIMADGSMRDTVVFSIINSEWPCVKQHLTFKLGR